MKGESNDSIIELQSRLEQLIIQHNTLGQEICKIKSEIEKRHNKTEQLEVGTKVKLLTPGKFKCTTGEITRVGKLISIRLSTGNITTRKRENIEVIKRK